MRIRLYPKIRFTDKELSKHFIPVFMTKKQTKTLQNLVNQEIEAWGKKVSGTNPIEDYTKVVIEKVKEWIAFDREKFQEIQFTPFLEYIQKRFKYFFETNRTLIEPSSIIIEMSDNEYDYWKDRDLENIDHQIFSLDKWQTATFKY